VSLIEVRDNELVQRGATLFKLDDAPFRIAVSDAAARAAYYHPEQDIIETHHSPPNVDA
jgi:multidrug resistance efflux pump